MFSLLRLDGKEPVDNILTIDGKQTLIRWIFSSRNQILVGIFAPTDNHLLCPGTFTKYFSSVFI